MSAMCLLEKAQKCTSNIRAHANLKICKTIFETDWLSYIFARLESSMKSRYLYWPVNPMQLFTSVGTTRGQGIVVVLVVTFFDIFTFRRFFI